MDRASWCYVCGLIGAQWDRLMQVRDLLGLVKVESEEERRQRIRLSLLFGETAPVGNPMEQIEQAFRDVVCRTARISPDSRIGDLFLLGQDWHGFRRFAKSAMLEQSAVGAKQAEPAESDERFTMCWNDRIEDERDRPFAEAAEHIRSKLPAEGDRAGWIDAAMDAHEAASLVRAAASLESDALLNWVQTWMNLRGALSLIRARRTGWETAGLLAQWQAVGFDDPALAEVASENEAEWPIALGKLGLPTAAAVLAEPEATVRLAREIENRVSVLASESTGMPFGPERVFAFLWALRAEAINLRLALSAATFGLPEDRVGQELRIGYV